MLKPFSCSVLQPLAAALSNCCKSLPLSLSIAAPFASLGCVPLSNNKPLRASIRHCSFVICISLASASIVKTLAQFYKTGSQFHRAWLCPATPSATSCSSTLCAPCSPLLPIPSRCHAAAGCRCAASAAVRNARPAERAALRRVEVRGASFAQRKSVTVCAGTCWACATPTRARWRPTRSS